MAAQRVTACESCNIQECLRSLKVVIGLVRPVSRVVTAPLVGDAKAFISLAFTCWFGEKMSAALVPVKHWKLDKKVIMLNWPPFWDLNVFGE
jgi:hypothetical protein